MMKSTNDVLSWFGNRGVSIQPGHLLWHWDAGKLWFIVRGQDDGDDLWNTDTGMVDITYTHREDGSLISVYELYKSVPLCEAPIELVKQSLTKSNQRY